MGTRWTKGGRGFIRENDCTFTFITLLYILATFSISDLNYNSKIQWLWYVIIMQEATLVMDKVQNGTRTLQKQWR